MPSVNVLASCRSPRDRSCPSAADRLTVQEARRIETTLERLQFRLPVSNGARWADQPAKLWAGSAPTTKCDS
jgi:hypothetical protein